MDEDVPDNSSTAKGRTADSLKRTSGDPDCVIILLSGPTPPERESEGACGSGLLAVAEGTRKLLNGAQRCGWRYGALVRGWGPVAIREPEIFRRNYDPPQPNR